MGTRIVKYIRYLFRCVLSVIYDDSETCVLCDNTYDDESHICCHCRKKIKECDIRSIVKREGFEISFYSSAYYSNIVKEMIIRLKYKSDFRCGEALAELMHDVIKRNALKFDLITFVPSSDRTLKKRGYNQSEFLAKLLGEKTGNKVLPCLKKTVETKDQIGLDGGSRWLNLKDCFIITDGKNVGNRRILLVDDVMTTGATAFYCAKELIKKGCSEVTVLTAAKSKI